MGKNLMDPDRQVFPLFIEIKRTVQLWSKSRKVLQSEVEMAPYLEVNYEIILVVLGGK